MTYDLNDPVGTYMRAWVFALAHSGSRAGQGAVLALVILTLGLALAPIAMVRALAAGVTGGRAADADPNYERRDPMNLVGTGVMAVSLLVLIGLGARALGVLR